MDSKSTTNSNEIAIKYEPDSSTTSEEDKTEMRLSILKLVYDLTHSLMCKNPDCCIPNCRKFKSSVLHSKTCKKVRGASPCVTCRDLFMLVCFHAHVCDEPETSPRCQLIGCPKTKLHLKRTRMKKQHKVNGSSSASTSFLPSSSCEEPLQASSTSSISISTSSSLSQSSNDVKLNIKIEPTTDSHNNEF